MITTQNILIISFFFGVYLFLSSFIVAPNKDIERVISKNRYESSDIVQDICRYIQKKIYNHIELSDAKESLIQSYLINERINQTAKDFITYNYAQSIFILIAGLVVCLVTWKWIFFVLFLFLALVNYRQQETKISKKFEYSKNEVEKDLAKFCSIIAAKVQSTNNVENIIKAFLPVANSSMRLQLEITLADIRTGNVQTALKRFESRILSRHLSDITRGLIAVANGDDQRIYFQVKEQEFNKEHQAILEREIENRTRKLLPLQIAIVVFFVACIIYPFGVTALRSAAELFGNL